MSGINPDLRGGTAARFGLALLGLAALAFSLAPLRARAAAAQHRPNILFIILDDWGWRDAGAYGAKWIRTPTFDRIAREGVLFQNAFTSNPKCGPSRATILTGRNAWQLEQGNVHFSSFPSKFPIYPDLLEQAGYAVGLTGKGWGPGNFAVTGWPHNPAGRSFDAATLKPPTSRIMPRDYAANFAQFLATVKPGQPFCFWFGLYEPHRPYERDSGVHSGRDPASVTVPPYLPDNETVRKDLLDYALEVEWADAQAGKALAALAAAGKLDDTLVVMTSDNGMPFPRVKGQIVDDDFHLPLAIRWGRIAQPGRVVDAFVGFRDFAPTFLTAAGVAVPGTMSGHDFLALLTSPSTDAPDSRQFVLAGKERHDLGRPHDAGYPVRAIRTNEWLYVRNYAPERWPAGNPETNFPNCDNGPTKDWVVAHRDRFFDLAFGKRPAESLYRVATDPACLVDRAREPGLAGTLATLRGRMEAELRAENDPRVLGFGESFDAYPWYGSRVHAYDTWRRKQRESPEPAGGTARAEGGD
jgi:arylsulfatase A-like enzyme